MHSVLARQLMPAGSPPLVPSPLASPSSPGEYMRLGLRPSSTSSHPENNDTYKFIKPYTKNFCTRLVQALVQARQNENYDKKCSRDPAGDWFNLAVDEIGEVSVQIKKSIRDFPPSIPAISIDFILYIADGETLPLETWTFSFESAASKNPFHSNPPLHSSQQSDTKSKLYSEMGVLLRSVMLASRMTPMHRYYVKKQSADTYVITYRVVEGKSTIDLGPDQKKKTLGHIATPIGNFYLDLAYRTRMEIDRASTPASTESFQQVHISPGTSPDANPPVGTPSSFCEVLSQFSASPSSRMTSPRSGRSRATSEATSDDGGCGPPVVEERKGEEEGKGEGEVKGEEEEEEDEEEVMKSMLASRVEGLPFANLLLGSYTGVLVTSGLGKDKEGEEEKEEEKEGEGKEDEADRTIGGDMSTSTRTVTAVEEEEAEDAMVETLKDANILGPSSNPPPLPQFSPIGERKSKDDSGSSDEEESSYIRIAPLFGSSASQTELAEMIEEWKILPELESVSKIQIDQVAEIASKELSEFASYQGDFDRLVAAVREAVEEDERKEREGHYGTPSTPSL